MADTGNSGNRSWLILAVVLTGSFMGADPRPVGGATGTARRRAGDPGRAAADAAGIRTGQSLAVLYFAGFTSLFFTLSIMWQEGLRRSALSAGPLVLPFALGSLLTAANSFRFSRRFGRAAIQAGIGGMLAGQAAVAVVLLVSGARPGYWPGAGPLLLSGLGNGLVIAPNQDFVLATVPRTQAGTAGGALITAQRLGAAIGIAVIGTALFGSGASGSASSGSSGSSGGPAGRTGPRR